MAGKYDKLFEEEFTSTSSIVVTHNLDRSDLMVQVIVDNTTQNQLIASVVLTPGNERNECTVNLVSAQTGRIQILSSDIRPAELPDPESAADIENATTDTGGGSGNAGFFVKLDSGGLLDGRDIGTGAAPVEITDTTNAEGSATTLARSDHQHAHGTRGGGSLHAGATQSTPGFMSAADKTRLDNKVFGEDYQYEEMITQSTTTSTSFVTFLTLVTPALTGTYRVNWTATVGLDDTSGDIYTRCQNVTDGDPISGESREEPSDVDEEIMVGGFEEVVFTGASKTFEVQWRTGFSTDTARISNSRIEIWRVS